MFSPLRVPAVVEVPQLRALVARVPLAELVAEAEDPLLGAGLLLVAAGAAEHGAEAGSPRIRAAASTVCSRLRARRAGLLDRRPASMSSCTLATISRSP